MKYLIRLLGKTSNVQVVLMCAHKLQSRMVCSMHPSFLLSHSFHLPQPHMAVYIMPNHFLLAFCSVCALWEFSNKFMPCCGVVQILIYPLLASFQMKVLPWGVLWLYLPSGHLEGYRHPWSVIKLPTHSCLAKGIGCLLKGRKQETDLLDCCFRLWYCYLMLLK